MNKISALGAYFLTLLCVMTQPAIAQDSSDESAVWTVVEQQWERNQRSDKRWVDEMLTEDFMGWSGEAPAPQNKSSVRMWNDFNREQAKLLEHELYPLSIVVHGDVAIAHYLYTQATENKKDDVEMSNGRYTDILIRENGDWRFLAWHGGNDE
jgi:ketosteroid isomerase-like protein